MHRVEYLVCLQNRAPRYSYQLVWILPGGGCFAKKTVGFGTETMQLEDPWDLGSGYIGTLYPHYEFGRTRWQG